jgi:pimeloyl-ACP methyl ester carboxylesterase
LNRITNAQYINERSTLSQLSQITMQFQYFFNNKSKRVLFCIGLLLLLGFLILNILAYNHARAMMNYSSKGYHTQQPENLSLFSRMKILFAGVNVPRPTTHQSPLELGFECDSIEIHFSETIRLSAWYHNQKNESPLVILFHGYAGEKSSMLPEAQAFIEFGMSVLLVDFRGSGESSEKYTTIGYHEAEDVAAVIRYTQTNFRHTSIILYGHSMGAVAILRAVHVYTIAPDAIIVGAVFDTMLNTVRNRFNAMKVPSFPSAYLLVFWGGWQWGFNGFSHNPIEYARSIHCPILFMHGANDSRAKIEEGRRVYNQVSTQKKFVEFHELGHDSYYVNSPQKWKTVIADFLKIVKK